VLSVVADRERNSVARLPVVNTRPHQLFGKCLINVSALSEARFRESVKLGEVLFARSIEPFEGGRWRLRWMRANGYGNSIFSPTCKLLVLRYLENEHVREPQFDALRWGMTCGA
jgi:hypothetical protein